MSGILYRGELSGRDSASSETYAHSVRRVFSSRSRTSEAERAEASRIKANQYLVKGRIQSGLVLWDVYSLDGLSKPKIAAAGFSFQEEAIAFARDRTLGRMAVSFSGVRGLFRKGAGGLAVPSRDVETPGTGVVRVQRRKDGSVVVG